MSTCLIITQGNKMYIGADSACSVKTPEGFRRYSDDMQKLFQLNEQVFFCSGNMDKVYECVDWIYNHFIHFICIEDLKDYLINNCNEPLDEYYNIEILIADYKTNVVYQLSQYNNFEILTYPYSEQLRIICGGYKTKNAFIMAKKNILLKQSIYNIYHNTYQDITDECVGGYLYLYSSPTDFCKDRIIEDNIKYVCQDNELHLLTSEFVTSGFINGTQMIGGDIYSQNYSVTDKMGMHIGLNDCVVEIGGDALTYSIENGLSIKGKITATSGSFTGEVTATTITTSNGTIGNFTLSDALYSGTDSLTSTTSGIYIGTDGIRQYYNAEQYTNLINGVLDCVGAKINGDITCTNIFADKGTIAGWTLSSNALYKDRSSFDSTVGGTYIGVDGIIQYASDYSYTSIQGGMLTTKNANIKGKVSADTFDIGGNTISIENKEDVGLEDTITYYHYDNVVQQISGAQTHIDELCEGKCYAFNTNLFVYTKLSYSEDLTVNNYIYANHFSAIGESCLAKAYINNLTVGFNIGTEIKLIKSGTTILTPGSSGTSAKLFTLATVQGWYSSATSTNTAIVITNGDGGANSVHVESATYHTGESSWYVVFASSTSSVVRVNYTVICW